MLLSYFTASSVNSMLYFKWFQLFCKFVIFNEKYINFDNFNFEIMVSFYLFMYYYSVAYPGGGHEGCALPPIRRVFFFFEILIPILKQGINNIQYYNTIILYNIYMDNWLHNICHQIFVYLNLMKIIWLQ